MRRLKRMEPGDVLLFIDATRLRLFPPLRSAWARKGEQARVPVTGRNAKRVLLGAINVPTGHRLVVQRQGEGGADARVVGQVAHARRPVRRAAGLVDPHRPVELGPWRARVGYGGRRRPRCGDTSAAPQ